MNCTEFDHDEIKRLAKRFKKLVNTYHHHHSHHYHHDHHYRYHHDHHYHYHHDHRRLHHHHHHHHHCSGPGWVWVTVDRGVYVIARVAAKPPCSVPIIAVHLHHHHHVYD